MNWLKNIVNDIKDRKYLESYVVLIVGIGVLLFDIFGDPDSSIPTEIILAILSVLIYLSILERRDYSKLFDQGDFIGINSFRPTRGKEHALDKYLPNAKSEIAMLAVQHSTIGHQYLGELEKKAKEGCKIKILMMAPRDEAGNVNPNVIEYESQRQYTDLLLKLEASTNTFKKWLSSLDNQVRERVEIRQYLAHPTVTYFFVDKDELDGFVQVEILLYQVHVRNYPRYLVMNKDNEEFFKTHTNSFEDLWKESQKLAL
ncbi:MAG: hypothetical protein GY797_34560 [Deltaproteobacteria bacterium]|nr:hypothetical protein [Deltaproteobacteria bacterium]